MAEISVKLRSGETVPMTYPDDWSTAQVESAIHESFPDEGGEDSSIPKTPFNESQSEPLKMKEHIDSKSLMSDLVHGLGKSVREGTDFAVKTPSMISSLAKHLKERPFQTLKHEVGQLAAGAAESGKDIANLGLSVGSSALKHLDPLGSALMQRGGKKIEAPQIPENTGVEKFFGTEKTEKEDRLVRALPEIAGVAKLAMKPITSAIKAFKSPDLKTALKETQAKVTAVSDKQGKIFDLVEDTLKEKGKNIVPVDKDVIEQAKSFLEKTPQAKDLIKRAEAGDYKALRDLQSDLRVKGEEALANGLSTETTKGKEILSTRKQINDSITQHLENVDEKELAKLLNQSRDAYRDIQKTYFSSPALARVFGKSQKLPKNPLTLLTEDSTEMTRLFKAHPEMKEMMTKALKVKRNRKIAASLGATALGGGSAGATYKVLGGK